MSGEVIVRCSIEYTDSGGTRQRYGAGVFSSDFELAKHPDALEYRVNSMVAELREKLAELGFVSAEGER